MERRLLSILMLDVVGYSRLVEENEGWALATVKQRRQTLIEPLLAEHGGRLIRFMGDGALIEFASAVNAVRYASTLQRAFAAANTPLPEQQRIALRIGVSLGDVVVDDGDVYGDGVNIAARLEPLAGPGEVLVSDAVYRQVRGKVEESFEDQGERLLKNLNEPVRIWRVGGAAAALPRAAEPGAGTPPHLTVAVLPFDNMSGDAEQAYFSDGITEDIITELSRFRELLVIARNSSFQFRNRAVEVKEIARRLDAQFIVQGSVRRVGNRVRVTAQLIDTLKGSQVWGDHYDRELTDIFAIQNEISQAIAVRVAGIGQGLLAKRARERPTTSLSAYDCYLRGVDSYSHQSAELLEVCRSYFESAAALDPNFARAWGYLAYTTMRGVINGWRRPEDSDQALVHARKAMQLDPDDYYNHWDVAFVLWHRKEFSPAIERYRRALSLNPNDADLLAEFGDTLAYWGEPAEGIALMRRAMAINPLFPDWYRWNMAFALFMVGAHEESQAEVAQILNPHSNVQLIAAANCVRLGQRESARQLIGAFLGQQPHYTVGMLRRRTAFKRREDEQNWIDALKEAGLPD